MGVTWIANELVLWNWTIFPRISPKSVFGPEPQLMAFFVFPLTRLVIVYVFPPKDQTTLSEVVQLSMEIVRKVIATIS